MNQEKSTLVDEVENVDQDLLYGDGPRSAHRADRKLIRDNHAADIRLSIPLPKFRFYISMFAGRERRAKERLAEERRRSPLITLSNLFFLLVLVAWFGGIAWIIFQAAGVGLGEIRSLFG